MQTDQEIIEHHFERNCKALSVLSRRRRHCHKKRALIDRPSEQQFVTELHRFTPDVERKTLYTPAKKLREYPLKHIDDWRNADDVRAAIASLNGREFSDAEFETMVAMSPFVRIDFEALAGLNYETKLIEKDIAAHAKNLPVADWWCSHPGMNVGGLGKLIGETGDLSNYPNPDKVKKRMGLAPVDGKACSTHRKDGSLTAKGWVEAGYSPWRRSVIWQIGDAIIKCGKGRFREIFDKRKLDEATNQDLPTTRVIVASSKTTADAWEAAGLPRPVVSSKKPGKGQISCGHIHNRAKRYMEQQLLIETWAEWNGQGRGES